MKTIGLRAYRFSIAWSRLLPSGRGRANPAGLDFYDRLVDTLLEAGIQPFVTLFCWDLPQALQDEGGWTKRSIVDAFVELVDLASRRLGDRVQAWATLNEPWVVAQFGYERGAHPPGYTNAHLALLASHHLLLAHARALPVLRRNSPKAQAGIVLNHIPFYPASASVYDRREAWFADGYVNRWYLNPITGRGYPEEVIQQDRLDMDFVQPGDLDEVAAPIDYLGVNYYRAIVRSPLVSEAQTLQAPREEKTEMGWEVYPEGWMRYSAACTSSITSRPIMSPKMVQPSPISRPRTARCTIRRAFIIWSGILPRQPTPSRRVCRCAAILFGR
jgi:beta-glucosidase